MIFNIVSRACPYIKRASKHSFIIKQAVVYNKSGQRQTNKLPRITAQDWYFEYDSKTNLKKDLYQSEQNISNSYYKNSISIVSKQSVSVIQYKQTQECQTVYNFRNYITPTIVCIAARKLTALFLATSQQPTGMDEADLKILRQFCQRVINVDINYIGPEQCYHVLLFFRINKPFMQQIFGIQLTRCQELRKKLFEKILSYQLIIDNIRSIDIFAQFTLHYRDYERLLNKQIINAGEDHTKTILKQQLKKIDQIQYRLVKLCLYKIKQQFQLQIDGPSNKNIGKMLKQLVKPFKSQVSQGPGLKQLQYRLVNISYHLCKGYSVCMERKKRMQSKAGSDKTYNEALDLINQLFNLLTILLIQGSKYLPINELVKMTNRAIGYILETSPIQKHLRLNYQLLQSLVSSIQLSLQKSNRAILQYIQITSRNKNSQKSKFNKQNYQMSRINAKKIIQNQIKVDITKSLQAKKEQILKNGQDVNKQSIYQRVHQFQNQQCLKVLKNVKKLMKQLKKQLKLDKTSVKLRLNRNNPEEIQAVIDIDNRKVNNILMDISKQITKIIKIIHKNKQEMQVQDYLKQFQDFQRQQLLLSRMRLTIDEISNRKVMKQKSQSTQDEQAYMLPQRFTGDQKENQQTNTNKDSHSSNKKLKEQTKQKLKKQNSQNTD